MAKLDTLRLIADKCRESARIELDNNKAEIVNTLDSILGADNYTYKIELDTYRFDVGIKSGEYECTVRSPWHWGDENFTLDVYCPIYSNKSASKEYAEMYWAAYMLINHEEQLREVVKSLSWDNYKAYDYARDEVSREERRIEREESDRIKDEVKKRIQVGATFCNSNYEHNWMFDTITKITEKCIYTQDEYGDGHRFKYDDMVNALYWAEIRYRDAITPTNLAMPVEQVTVKYEMWDKADADGAWTSETLVSDPFPYSKFVERSWLPDDYDEETMYISIRWRWDVSPYFPSAEPTFDPLEGVE